MITVNFKQTSSPVQGATKCSSCDATTYQQPRLNWLQRQTRRKFINWLRELRGGTIELADLHGSKTYGRVFNDALHADWTITDAEFYSHLAASGSIGVAESYLRGQWHTSDLTSLMRILCRNISRTAAADQGFASLRGLSRKLLALRLRNTARGSRRNIAAHYDLSNEFFELFLDSRLMYSAAYFEQPDATLEEASLAKIERVCAKLDICKDDRVVEIGSGWGGLAVHAASQYGCEITTTTISAAQFAIAQQRVIENGLEDRVEVLQSDYRDLSGQYDKLVSIEMVEAVGERYLDDYFRQCGRLLRPGGRCLIQAIVMPEERYQAYRRRIDFIQKYIFPGGFLPSVAAVQESVGRTSNLRLASIEDMSSHYAKTLEQWRIGFLDSLDLVRQLGFDERFICMWEYYLCSCQAAFREQTVRVVQMVWDKPYF